MKSLQLPTSAFSNFLLWNFQPNQIKRSVFCWEVEIPWISWRFRKARRRVDDTIGDVTFNPRVRVLTRFLSLPVSTLKLFPSANQLILLDVHDFGGSSQQYVWTFAFAKFSIATRPRSLERNQSPRFWSIGWAERHPLVTDFQDVNPKCWRLNPCWTSLCAQISLSLFKRVHELIAADALPLWMLQVENAERLLKSMSLLAMDNGCLLSHLLWAYQNEGVTSLIDS